MQWKVLFATIVIILIVLIVAVYLWYDYPSAWAPFTITTGQNLNIVIPTGKNFYNLRFKNCKFNVYNSSGAIVNTSAGTGTDVTGTLNNMCKSYGIVNAPASGITTTNHPNFNLVAPLNMFSFNIPGFNDTSTIPPATKISKCTGGAGKPCTSNAQCAGPVSTPNTKMPAASNSSYGTCMLQNLSSECPKLTATSIAALPTGCVPICVSNTAGASSWTCNPLTTATGTTPTTPIATTAVGVCQVCDSSYMVALTGYYRIL
jgi:hypothetical protein